MHVYVCIEGEPSAKHVKHTLFFFGEGNEGTLRYVAASFENGKRYSLASSGTGSFAVQGDSVLIKAGGLNATGTFHRKDRVVMGHLTFTYEMTM